MKNSINLKFKKIIDCSRFSNKNVSQSWFIFPHLKNSCFLKSALSVNFWIWWYLKIYYYILSIWHTLKTFKRGQQSKKNTTIMQFNSLGRDSPVLVFNWNFCKKVCLGKDGSIGSLSAWGSSNPSSNPSKGYVLFWLKCNGFTLHLCNSSKFNKTRFFHSEILRKNIDTRTHSHMITILTK